jgi:hypothetical protein
MLTHKRQNFAEQISAKLFDPDNKNQIDHYGIQTVCKMGSLDFCNGVMIIWL